jgi:flagellar basal body-associated protein FliL
MAEQTPAPEQTQEQQPAAKSSKTLVLVIAIVVLEVATVGVTYMLMGGPKPAEASSAEPDPQLDETRLVEIALVSDKFPNTRTGKTFVYDADVLIVVQRRHQEKAAKVIESSKAQITEDIRQIISRADRSELNESTLATVKRQIQARLEQRLGRDTEGKAIVDQIVIRKFTEFQLQ